MLKLQRFDRDYTDKGYLRSGFARGLTVLDCGDSHLDRERCSYPLVADNLRRWSDKPEADGAELFRRMVFNAAMTHNDDHPRNHALLRGQKGWRLSPAYDVMPRTRGQPGAARPGVDHRRLRSHGQPLQPPVVGRAFRFVGGRSARGIDRLVDVVRHRRDGFFACGVSVKDIDYIAPAILSDCFFFERQPVRKSLSRVHLRQATNSFFADVGIQLLDDDRARPDLLREGATASAPRLSERGL